MWENDPYTIIKFRHGYLVIVYTVYAYSLRQFEICLKHVLAPTQVIQALGHCILVMLLDVNGYSICGYSPITCLYACTQCK